jgi:hypothetical protein
MRIDSFRLLEQAIFVFFYFVYAYVHYTVLSLRCITTSLSKLFLEVCLSIIKKNAL